MRKKREKLPDHLFAPKPIRILAIIQLCLAFIALGWVAITPFLSDYFAINSQILLIQTITGQREVSEDLKPQLQRNRERFNKLLPEEQVVINNNYLELKKLGDQSFSRTAGKVAKILLFKLSPFLQAWIFFSILVSLLILLKIEGATQSSWVLPLIMCTYYCYSLIYSPNIEKTQVERLFPNEKFIVENYLKEPLSNKISSQRIQLMHGWELYLVEEWTGEPPSINAGNFKHQVEEGEFAFSLAKLNAEKKDYLNSLNGNNPPSYLLIILAILWGVFFSIMVNRRFSQKSP